MQEFIRIENVAFSYEKENAALPAVLTGINLRIDKGESIALIGANGSGKSTLAKLLNALLIPQSGIVRVAGMDTREQTNHAAIRASVGMVFQRPQDQIVASTVEEDVAFGPANLGLPSGEVRARVELALASTRLNTYCERSSLLLSAGETQRLALAGVLAMKPECVIFDETTAMLDPQGRDMVLQQVRALNDQGITTILITHLMQEAVHCARVLLLHKGRLLLDGSPTDVFVKNSNLEKFGLTVPDAYTAGVMLKRFFPSIPEGVLEAEFLLKSLPPYNGQMRPPMHGSHEKRKTGQALITIEGLGYSYMAGTPLAHPALEHVDMRIEKGQIHALLGGTGSGKTTLLQHCNGLIRPQSGRVLVDGSDLGDKKLDVKQLRRKVALAFQQPEDQVFEQYVGDEIAFGPRKLGFEGKISDVVKTAMAYVGLDFEQYKDRLVSTLSGGERRKVALASVLAAQPQILLLDEPFSGLDPVSTRNLVVQIRQWKQAGKTICISTHQYEEPAQILDRVSVIHEGKDVLHGSAGAVLGRVNAMTAAGLKAPLAAQIAQVLIEKGWPLEEDNASLQALEKNLEGLLGCKK